MAIPTCVEWFVWLASGVFIVPLLELLKKVPTVGPVVAQLAWIIAPLLAVLAPVIAEAGTAQCPKVDPLLWIMAYTGLTYLFSQVTYWLAKKAGVVK